MDEKIYQKLAVHLNQFPDGFPPSKTGSDLRLLQRLFTPEEAALAIHLTLARESAQTIAKRAGLPSSIVQERLQTMASKGLIFSAQSESGPELFQGVPFAVGIYEYQVNVLDEALLGDLLDYWKNIQQDPTPDTIPQVRTIPIGESIEPHLEALPYEQVKELVQSHEHFAVAPCICRRQARLLGEGCEAPEETCLMFGDWANYYVQSGRGRSLERSEVLGILERADQHNLVLQPSNAQDISFICCCCGCCCGVLRGLKAHPRPAEAVASAFISQLDPERCDGCWTCLERCQMDALLEDGDRVRLDADRCIGCGLCVTTCQNGALSLARKPTSERTQPPKTLDDTWRIITRAQIEFNQTTTLDKEASNV